MPNLLCAYKEDIRYYELVNALNSRGIQIPTGSGVPVSIIENTATSGAENHLPNPASSEFSGKTINDIDVGSGISSHATAVGKNLFGNTSSVAPGITQIDAYGLTSWLDSNSGWLTGTPPIETNPLQNHSWVSWLNSSNSSNPCARMDYAVNRDGLLPVVGLYNTDFGDQNIPSEIPDLYATIYNGITVGVSDGTHHYGQTNYNGSGRTKPEIVAPSNFTSYAAPMVTSVAAFLIDAAGANANAKDQLVLKAIILAGADKSFALDWDQTTTRPIDEKYGAGELDIYESYFIQASGQYDDSANNLEERGWDLKNIGNNWSGGSYTYNITVPFGFELRQFSTLLTWNVRVNNFFNPSLANLALHLRDSSNNLLQTSDSPVDNIEHIWRDENNTLTAGNYTLQVTSNRGTEYALAWRSQLYQDYTLWQTTAFDANVPSEQQDPEYDLDHDGMSNFMEHALGSNPNDANDVGQLTFLTTDENNKTYLELSFTRPSFQNNLVYIVQTTEDITSWPADGAGVDPNPVIIDNGDNTETYTYRRTKPISENQVGFIRLNVSSQ
ncbi:MAG: hypothetical protein L7R84_02785 [Balneolaceae bacterium]|nr:hypothetical protein [Balneolaceae bacterium]